MPIENQRPVTYEEEEAAYNILLEDPRFRTVMQTYKENTDNNRNTTELGIGILEAVREKARQLRQEREQDRIETENEWHQEELLQQLLQGPPLLQDYLDGVEIQQQAIQQQERQQQERQQQERQQ